MKDAVGKKSIFRIRPSNDLTIDELKKEYLWFSKPTEYKDQEDANIIAFLEANENVKDAFNRVFSNYKDLGKSIEKLGICCFTEDLPVIDKWKCFPKGHNGIVVEYDKARLEKYFLDKYYMGNCFSKVEYLDDPIKLLSSTNDGYDILWEVDENKNYIYESIRGSIERKNKKMEEFLIKLLTRINIRYQIQKENRIILSQRIVAKFLSGTKGYQIPIPIDLILNIYIKKSTPPKFIKSLRETIPSSIPIIMLS